MPDATPETLKPDSGSAWSELIASAPAKAGSDGTPAEIAPGSKITTAVDVKTCPRCEAPAVKLGIRDRVCNTCGLVWTVITPRDELDAKADRELRSREFSEGRGRGRKIGRGATRW